MMLRFSFSNRYQPINPDALQTALLQFPVTAFVRSLRRHRTTCSAGVPGLCGFPLQGFMRFRALRVSGFSVSVAKNMDERDKCAEARQRRLHSVFFRCSVYTAPKGPTPLPPSLQSYQHETA